MNTHSRNERRNEPNFGAPKRQTCAHRYRRRCGVCVRSGRADTEPTLPKGMPNVAVTPGVTMLCQVGLGAAFEVRVGLNAAPRELSIPDGGCETVATVDPAQRDDVVVSVVEKPGTYYVVDRLVIQHGDEPARVMTATSSASFEGAHGAVLTYFNNAAVNVCEFGAGASFQYQVGLGTAFRDLDVPEWTVHARCVRRAGERQ